MVFSARIAEGACGFCAAVFGEIGTRGRQLFIEWSTRHKTTDDYIVQEMREDAVRRLRARRIAGDSAILCAVQNKKRIAVVPGDGIGKEVIPQAVRVMQATGAPVEFTEFDWGADRYLKDGTTIPADGFQMLARDFDAIFVGALGDPRVPTNIHAKEILLGMRFKMDLYANVRPVKLLDESLCPLKNAKPEDVDFVVIRENTEGVYMDMGGLFKAGTPDEVATQEDINTRKGVERVIRFAFEYAQDERAQEGADVRQVERHDLRRRTVAAGVQGSGEGVSGDSDATHVRGRAVPADGARSEVA